MLVVVVLHLMVVLGNIKDEQSQVILPQLQRQQRGKESFEGSKIRGTLCEKNPKRLIGLAQKFDDVSHIPEGIRDRLQIMVFSKRCCP
jgi:hypothetical protein